MTIRVGIAGYGNLGRGVECALRQNPDMTLAGVFSRRSTGVTTRFGAPVFAFDEAEKRADAFDVLILCGGSATDLPGQTPRFAAFYNVLDSFDTHADIPAHFERVDKAAKESGHAAMISVGWDPGLFSHNRLLAEAVLPEGSAYTFWGKGVSQGHSDAVRRIDGVLDARQYTVPVDEAVAAVRRGECPALTTRQKHKRDCFVVAEEGADKAKIEHDICTMPNYFADYDTTVHFISAEEMARDHAELPHGGMVFRSGVTGEGAHRHVIEYRLTLASNPEFTASVLCAYARALYRMKSEGKTGAFTVFDVPPAYLSPKSAEELRKTML